MKRKTSAQPAVIARRRTCKATGTGLSHYIIAPPRATAKAK